MLCQNDSVFSSMPDFQHYACRFLDLARSREAIAHRPWTARELMDKWVGARGKGIISGDLNHDGDFDDDGEDTILDDVALIEYLELPLRITSTKSIGLPTMIDDNGVERIAPSDTPLDPRAYWVLERWVYKIGHFVQGDGTGRKMPIYDSILYGSQTRRKGRIESLRVYLITS